MGAHIFIVVVFSLKKTIGTIVVGFSGSFGSNYKKITFLPNSCLISLLPKLIEIGQFSISSRYLLCLHYEIGLKVKVAVKLKIELDKLSIT